MTADVPRLYLASQSPRRAQLLRQIAINFKTLLVSVDETPLVDEPAEYYVQRLAIAKARAGWVQVEQQKLPQLPVLGADTAVICENEILGKPADRSQGLAMLRSLSGKRHQVMTGVCFCLGEQQWSTVNITEVTFRNISNQELSDYWDSGEPEGKAGAYAIQGRAAIFIKQLTGSYSSVVGLPLFETSQLLNDVEKEAVKR